MLCLGTGIETSAPPVNTRSSRLNFNSPFLCFSSLTLIQLRIKITYAEEVKQVPWSGVTEFQREVLDEVLYHKQLLPIKLYSEKNYSLWDLIDFGIENSDFSKRGAVSKT